MGSPRSYAMLASCARKANGCVADTVIDKSCSRDDWNVYDQPAPSVSDRILLDHVGFAARALSPQLEAFRRAGFAPTQPRPLMGRDPDTGQPRPLGQDSAHLVFRHGYVELTAVPNPASGNHLEPFLARYEGLHILALHADDLPAAHARLAAAGWPVTDITPAQRAIEYGEQHGTARFEWFMIAPEAVDAGLVCVMRGLTPELVYQQAVQSHPNTAYALREVVIATDDLARTASLYEALTGAPPVASDDGLVFTLGEDRLRLLAAAALPAMYRAAAPGNAPGLVGITIEVESVDAAAHALAAAGLQAQRTVDALIFAAEDVGGAVIRLAGSESPPAWPAPVTSTRSAPRTPDSRA